MIKTAYDLEKAINFLTKDIPLQMNEGMYDQSRTLNSQTFNTTINTIEEHINTLYEKSRVLQDISKYTKEFLEQNIYSINDEVRTILKNIEEDRDKLKNKNYIAYDASINPAMGPYIDRDGSTLQRCEINNNKITLSGQNEIKIDILNIERKSKFPAYKNNLESFMKNKDPYRTFYILDGPVPGGMMEEFIVTLKNNTEVNYVDILPSNCKITNVHYIDENGNETYDNNYNNPIIPETKMQKIKFILATQAYKNTKYQIDKSRLAEDFWSKVNEKEYNAAAGIKTIDDYDYRISLEKYKEEYKKYLEDLKTWEAEKAEVERQNKLLMDDYERRLANYYG